MSVSTMRASLVAKLPRQSDPPAREPLRLKVLLVVAVGVDLTILVAGSVAAGSAPSRIGWEFVAWVVVVALVALVPVPTEDGPQLGMDLPLLLAAGFLHGPIVSGTIAFVGYTDLREFRGQISALRALYNRAQTSLSTMAAAAVFAQLGVGVNRWPAAAGAALLSLGADCIVNYSMVLVAFRLHARQSVRRVLATMKFGSRTVFAVTYVCFGLLGLLLAEIHMSVGVWGLASFAMPVLLARLAFAQSQRLDTTDRRFRERGKTIEELSGRIADERRDERLTVAAGLHDDVLPPLYKVHLMGQVLRQDLASGQLLALEEDVPELLTATEHASDAMRTLIRRLRKSAVGSGGLAATLRLLVRELESTSHSTRILLDCEDVGGSPLIQLLTYQVAREAIRNAVRHSQANRVRVTLTHDQTEIRLVVEDDGCGFNPRSIDTDHHFGLLLMKERIELAGGLVAVNSEFGVGTRVVVRLPERTSED